MIKSEHPFWGYSPPEADWAYMKYRLNQTVNKKRIYRIMKENNLLVTPNLRLRARRDNQSNGNKSRAARPNQFWGTDMTKVLIGPFGWLYLVVVLDWYTKKIVGYSISIHSRTEDWLDALNDACNMQFPAGILREREELYLVSDNSSSALGGTSKKFMQVVPEADSPLADMLRVRNQAGLCQLQ